MKITAQDLIELKIIDEIVAEPVGGAHRNHEKILRDVEAAISKHLLDINILDRKIIIQDRRDKFLSISRDF